MFRVLDHTIDGCPDSKLGPRSRLALDLKRERTEAVKAPNYLHDPHLDGRFNRTILTAY
jgi:hypothetical protein